MVLVKGPGETSAPTIRLHEK